MSFRRIDASGAIASPELLLHRDPNGGFSEHDLVRVGNQFFSAWFYGTTTPAVAGAWYATDGQRLSPLTEYYTSPPGESVALVGLVARDDHVTTVYRRYSASGPGLPAEQVHVDLAGGVVDGPRQIVAESAGLGYALGGSQQGLALQFTHASQGPGIYLRRVHDDGILGSPSFLVQLETTGWGMETGSVSHQGRAYGNLWLQRVTQSNKDLYFEASPGYELTVAGAGPSPSAAPVATLLQPETPSGPSVTSINAYGAPGYGVNVAPGAITGDDVDRVLTGPGPGPGFGPQVRAFSYRGAALAKVNFYAYGTLRYGVKPQAGDLDGDAAWELLTAPGPGAVFGPHVRGFQYDNAQVAAMPKVSFYAYGTLKYGANVAAGNLDADGTREILTGPGPGAVFGTHLRGFQYDNAGVTSMSGVNATVFPGATHGIHVASGDTDWDGIDDVAAAPGPSPSSGARVAVYDVSGGSLVEMPGSRFHAFAGALGGAQVSFCQWVGEDLNRELLASRGPLPGSVCEVSAFDDAGAAFAPLATFEPYPGQTHGSTLASVYVGF